jgi:glycosyltransferase involved in cell wall biosynthesis
MKPDISVVIPLYNKKRYIQRTLDSVLCQTIRNFECLIIDSSTDGSTDVVNHIEDPRIVHVMFEKSTAAMARNHGAQVACSDLIAFLDADDEWQPDHLETLISLRKKFPDAGLYATPYVKIRPDGRPLVMLFFGIPPPPWEGYVPDYLRTCSKGDELIHSSSCAVPRKIFEIMGGFPENIVYGEDQFLWGKIAFLYPVAFSWKGLTIYHTDALGRICDEAHMILEHPFSTYLRQELTAGAIPPERLRECRAYIRRKRHTEIFTRLVSKSVPTTCESTNGQVTDHSHGSGRVAGKFNTTMNVIGRTLLRVYHSSIHDYLRRCLCRIYGSYDPGQILYSKKGDKIS